MQQRPGGLEAGGTEGSPPPSPEPGTRGLRRGAREPAAGQGAAPPAYWVRLGSRPRGERGSLPGAPLLLPGPAAARGALPAAAPVTCAAAPPLGGRCSRPGAATEGAGGPGSALPSPLLPPRPAPSSRTPPPSRPRRGARHHGEDFGAAAPQSPQPAERERAGARAGAAAVAAFRAGGPGIQPDPLLSPPPAAAAASCSRQPGAHGAGAEPAGHLETGSPGPARRRQRRGSARRAAGGVLGGSRLPRAGDREAPGRGGSGRAAEGSPPSLGAHLLVATESTCHPGNFFSRSPSYFGNCTSCDRNQ